MRCCGGYWKSGNAERHPAVFYEDPQHSGWRENYVYRLPSGQVVAIYEDVTARRRYEERLSMYRLLVSAARDIMCFVRADDGVIVEANSAAERALGYSRAELLGLDIYQLRATAGGPLSADLMKAATAKGVLFETELRRKDGSVFPVEISARGTTVVDGEEVYLWVVRDISERRQAELEREGLLRDLRFQSEQLSAQSEQLQAQRDMLVRQVELRAVLGAIDELIHSTLDAKEMLERTVSEAVRAMGIDAAVIEPAKTTPGLCVTWRGCPATTWAGPCPVSRSWRARSRAPVSRWSSTTPNITSSSPRSPVGTASDRFWPSR